MQARRCPKGAVDWYDDLLRATISRRSIALHCNRRDQNQWEEAVKLLEKSQKSIYLQLSGQNKGVIVGIPEKISNVIQQTLIKIVEGTEPVIPEGHDPHQEAKLEDDKFLRKMVYRSCNYALLAALYKNYQGPCENVSHQYSSKY